MSRRPRSLGLLLSLVALSAGFAVAAAPTPVAAASVCAEEAATESSAAQLAVRCGRRVEIGSARTEYATAYAQPDGRLTFESAVVPQRARKPDGSWAAVDLALVRQPDGTLRPAVSVADVRFSGDGTGPMVTLRRAGRTFTLTWPTPLRSPRVEADAATYPEVLPGVDLVLRATRTGFTHVLVVKTAQAARQGALRRISLGVGGDARAVRLPDGTLRAQAGGTVVATADRPVMWDSAPGTADERGQGAARLGPGPVEPDDLGSTSARPGDFAARAAVRTEVTPQSLDLIPDVGLLTGPGTAYPVFIDPAWSVARNKWAYATNNGETNTDYTAARVGRNPDTGALYRSYFMFPTTSNGVSLGGKHIQSAYVQMKLDHSWSCGDTPTYMYNTPVISTSPKESWSGMWLSTLRSTAYSHANEAGGCGQIYPDMIVNFTGSAVTGLVQNGADSKWATVTVGFCACSAASGTGESTQDRWKRWFPADAKLIVDYDSKPGTPTGLQVSGIACSSASIPVGTLSPKLSAVYPDADTGQTLKGTYEWVEVPSGGVGAITASTPRKTAPAQVSATANGRATTAALTGVLAGKRYAFRVRTTDPAPYLITSPWSGWCQFHPDTSVPPVTVTLLATPSGPGTRAVFRIQSTATDVTKFRYGWTSPASTWEVAAPSASPKSVDVTVTVPRYGVNIFHAAAVDATLNVGHGNYDGLVVQRPSPPVGQWRLERAPGEADVVALADGSPDLAGDTPLTPSGVTWSEDVRVIGAGTATFNGASAEATTAGPVLDTTNSFSVSAWVRLAALPSTVDAHAVSQAGTDAAGFALGTRLMGSPLTPRWAFLMKDTAAQSSTTRAAVTAGAITSADVGRWTHLVGVYDRTAGKIRLYVNGALAQEVDRTVAPWAAGGAFAVGRSSAGGGTSNRWPGAIAQVSAFNRVVVADDFTGQVITDPATGQEYAEPGMFSATRANRWDFERTVPCYEDTTEPFLCEEWENTKPWRFALTAGSNVGLGIGGVGLHLNGTHWIDDPSDPHYQEATQEYARTQRNAGSAEAPVWQDTPSLRTDGSFSVAVWVHLENRSGTRTIVSQDSATGYSGFDLGYRATGSTTGEWTFSVRDAANSGTVTTVAFAAAPPDQLLSNWYHVAGVLDAGARKLRLYVDGRVSAEVSLNAAWQPWQADGPLVVGRSHQPAGATNWLHGGVDELWIGQGVLTGPGVVALREQQAALA
ncbi:MAG TPA: LamG domain-containing protein [Pilimelia sp.]|nr:LamG domain-containing protein [Pilimelia sp.]